MKSKNKYILAERRKKYTPIALIVFVGLLTYINSINGKFIWDDFNLIKDNVYIKNWSKLPEIFTENIGAGAGRKYDSYRPLQMFTYMIDYSLWKMDVRGYHLTNIFLHILAALGIYWLAKLLFKNRILSLFTSILFVIHPIHTAAVSYISGRADPLALLFILLTLIFYIKGQSIVAVMTYLLALLSRENSLILPALLLLYHYCFKKEFKVKMLLPILGLSLIYIILRLTVLRHLLSNTSCPTTLCQRLPGFFIAITDYLRLMILPFSLHMEYGNKLFSITNPKAISGILILCLLLTYAFKKRDNLLLSFSILWFFTGLVPSSNIYPINAYMAEHWLYLPSIGFFLIMAKVVYSVCQREKFGIISIILFAGSVIFYTSLTLRQNVYWREPVAFYERTLKYAPKSSRIYNDLGVFYKEIGKKEKAISILKKAIEIEPKNANAYNSLGNTYNAMGKYKEAIAAYKSAIEIEPDNADIYTGLGNSYRAAGNKEEAIASYKKAIEITPTHVQAYNNMGIAYREIGEIEKAIASYQEAIKIAPYNAEIYYNLGNVYSDIGKNIEAIASYQKAIEIEPDHVGAHNNISIVYFHEKQYKLAIKHCDKAKELGLNNTNLLEALKPYRR